MNNFDLDRLCAEALQRLAYFINRSTGQHMRAMRSTSPLTQPATTTATTERNLNHGL